MWLLVLRVIAEYRTGKTVVLEDIFDDEQARGYEAGAVAAESVRSIIAAQLMKEGQWVATFYVQDTSARRWTESEIELVEQTAERTWAAVERARAEEALYKSGQQLRFATRAVGMYSWELDVATGDIRFSGDVKGIIGFSYSESDDVFSRIRRYTVPEDGARHARAPAPRGSPSR